MIVFKTFLKVLNKCKAPIIIYTVFLIFFGGFNLQTSSNSLNFEAIKPDVLIVNQDQKEGITGDLIKYIKKSSNIIDIKNNEVAISDALFYRDVSYIIYIPRNFRKEFLNQQNPEIKVKSTGDYEASLAEMMLEKYMKVANTYNKTAISEANIIKNINETLNSETKIEVTSKLNTSSLSKATFYYNFTNYCLLAGCIYVICLILASFKNENIEKRTSISSIDYKKYNRQLLLSNGLFSLVLWLFYILLSFILLGNIMFTINGLFYILNSFVFTFCSLTIAFLLGSLVTNKNAINGIVNVIALGSSFLCGAFVPMELLPESVLKLAHILPSYWYIKTNEIIKTMEIFNFNTLKPILVNMLVIVMFSVLFVTITNFITARKRKIN